MSEPTPKNKITSAICLNGQCFINKDAQSVALSVTDRGLLLGDGLFETLPILNGQALWWDRHMQRLMQSAAEIGIPLNVADIDESVETLRGICEESQAILRITITRGSGGRGLVPPQTAAPTVMASLIPMPKDLAFQDAKLITSSIRRNDLSPTSRIKSLNYLDNILASQEAERQGADDALMLNTRAMAASSTIGNLFAVFDKRIITPPISDGVLPGIMRGQLIKLAPTWGLEVVESSLSADQLKKADGLFLTNSLRIIRRVTQLDNHLFGPFDETRDVIGSLQNKVRDHIKDMTNIELA